MISYQRKRSLERQKIFDQLDKEVLSCHRCPGLNIPYETMNAGAGFGSINAKLMVIGQSLHGYNDRTPNRQIPFVGPIPSMDSGIILYKALEEAGYSFKTENLFITNVVACHPPNNRKSRPEEIKNCSRFLESTLDIVRPQIILTVGTDAREWFGFPRQNNGEFVSYFQVLNKLNRFYMNPVKAVVSVHPSYVKRWGTVKDEQTYINQLVEALKQAE